MDQTIREKQHSTYSAAIINKTQFKHLIIIILIITKAAGTVGYGKIIINKQSMYEC